MEKATKRRIEISVETHEIKIIRIRGGLNITFCDHCGEEKSSFTSEEIAGFLKISVEDVCGDIETGKFHLTGNENGKALICGDSFRNEGQKYK